MDINEYMDKVNRGLCDNRGCGGQMITAFLFLLFFMLCSCKQVEYVPVIEHHTDTTVITKWQRDSVWLHDSVTVREKGDTLLIEKWHTKYIEKLRTDTIYRHKNDSVPVPYPVEKKLSRWQQAKMDVGGWAIFGMIGAIVFVAVRYGRKLYKVYRFF